MRRCAKKTLAELSQQYALHPTQITEWKRQLLEHAADVFGHKPEPTVDLASLHEKIGRQALELDFLSSALTKAGLLSAARCSAAIPPCPSPSRRICWA